MTVKLDEDALKVLETLRATGPFTLNELVAETGLALYRVDLALGILAGQKIIEFCGPPDFKYRAIEGGTDAAKTSRGDC